MRQTSSVQALSGCQVAHLVSVPGCKMRPGFQDAVRLPGVIYLSSIVYIYNIYAI